MPGSVRADVVPGRVRADGLIPRVRGDGVPGRVGADVCAVVTVFAPCEETVLVSGTTGRRPAQMVEGEAVGGELVRAIDRKPDALHLAGRGGDPVELDVHLLQDLLGDLALQLDLAPVDPLRHLVERHPADVAALAARARHQREAGAALQHVDGIHEARLRQLRELQAPGRVVGLPATGVVVLEAPPGVYGALKLAHEGGRGEALRQLLRERGGEGNHASSDDGVAVVGEAPLVARHRVLVGGAGLDGATRVELGAEAI